MRRPPGGARPDAPRPGDRLRGRAARRPAERAGGRAARRQGRVRAPAGGRRACRSSRPPASCTRDGCRSSPTPSELLATLAAEGLPPDRAYPVLVPNERGLDRALEAGRAARRDLRQRHRVVRPAQPQPRPGRAVRDVRAGRRRAPGRPASTCAPTCRCASATRGRATSRRRRWSTPARRLLDLGASQLSLGDTIGVGTAGHVTALLGAFGDAGVSVDRLALHLHDTYGQALANVLAAPAARRHHVRRVGRRAGRAAPTPRALPATSRPRTWSGCSTVSASRPASTSNRWSPPAPGWPGSWVGPARRGWCGR